MRTDLEIEIRRPKQHVSDQVMKMSKSEIETGSQFDMGKLCCTVSLPKKSTDFCTLCGVIVAFKLCSACKTVACCCKEHTTRQTVSEQIEKM